MSSFNSKTACDLHIAEVSTGNKKVLSDLMPKLDKLWIFYPHLLKLNFLMFGSLFTQITKQVRWRYDEQPSNLGIMVNIFQ